ncbi:SDR family oxidoreductase [Streptomyces sp. NPDC057889]|uniref:SDR family oxidoreductase n=1 Tax=unclassified Streptomyces TaxID=2593676 RepID=UPI0036C84573
MTQGFSLPLGPVTERCPCGFPDIGAATVRALLKQGHRVAVTGRDAEKQAAFAASAGAGERLLTITGDEHDVPAAVRHVVDAWGRLDNVIANAGFSLPGNLESHVPEDMRAMVLTNVLGPALVLGQRMRGPLGDRVQVAGWKSTTSPCGRPGRSVDAGLPTPLRKGALGPRHVPRSGGRPPYVSQPTPVSVAGHQRRTRSLSVGRGASPGLSRR